MNSEHVTTYKAPLSFLNLERRSRFVIIAGFLIQIITAITQVGYLHPDQHFQFMEFATQWLGMESYAPEIWEFNEHIRPTIGVYLIAFLFKGFSAIGLNDPYFFYSFLRLATAIGGFALFNHLLVRLIGTKNSDVLFYSLILLNLSWCYPFVRSLAGSEAWGAIFFFSALVVYFNSQLKRERWNLFAAGIIMSISFFFRFQMGFAILAVFLWVLVYDEKKLRNLVLLSLGFAIGSAFNIGLDSSFYGQFVITPVRYFTVNIIDGVASNFGTSPPTYYFGELLVVLFAPLLSIYLFFYLFRGTWKRRTDILVWIFIAFLIGHSLVGHKEERFLFPIFGILPILIGYAMLDASKILTYFQTSRFIKYFILPITLTLNLIAISTLMVVPYSQTIRFSEKLSNNFAQADKTVEVYYLDRSPFETPSKLIHHYYLNNLNERVNLRRIMSLSELDNIDTNDAYFCGTYNLISKYESTSDFDIGNQEIVFKSSSLLWNVNEFLQDKGVNTIEDIWVMVKL